MKNILYVADLNLANGGAQHRTYMTIPLLAKRFNIVVASLGEPDKTFKALLETNKICFHIVPQKSQELLRKLVSLAQTVRPDLLVIQWEEPGVLMILRRFRDNTKCPYAILVHELPLLGTPPKIFGKSAFENILFGAAVAFLTRDFREIVERSIWESESYRTKEYPRFQTLKKIIRRTKNYFDQKLSSLSKSKEIQKVFSEGFLIVISRATRVYIRVLYPDVKCAILLSPGNGGISVAKVDASVSKYDLAFMARLTSEKGIYDLIKIVQKIKRSYDRNVKVIVIGRFLNRIEEIRFRRCLSNMGLISNITLLGYVSEPLKYQLLRSARVFVYPSSRDGFSLSALDALASGLPAITWDLPFSRYVLTCPAVIRVKYGDIPQFANECVRLLREDELRLKLRNDAINFAQGFSWDKVAENEATAYNEILAKH